jgi:phosphatidylglycerol:prolipoprotein diacylglycerol transferase
MLPILQIGPLAIQLPGLLLVFGLWLGLSLAEKYSHHHSVAPNQVYTITFTTLVAAVLSARLVYVIRNISAFAHSPGGIISLNLDLLDPWGAILGAGLVSGYFIRRYKLNPWSLCDALAPILAVLMIAIHLSNLASGNGFGAPTSLPWAIYLFGEWRHPAQIYELIAAGMVLAIFWPGSRRIYFIPAGRYALTMIAATAGCRLFLEAFRGDSPIISGGLRSAQVIAWLILALTLWLISHRIRQPAANKTALLPPNEGTLHQ